MTSKIIATILLLFCFSVNPALIAAAESFALNSADAGWLSLNNSVSEIFRLESAPPPATPKFALLVGISDYKETDIQDLVGPVNGVFSFKELLIDKFQFPNQPQNIKILCNGKMTIKTKYDAEGACTESATADNIEKWFKEILIENARKNPNATFVFQFIGHGSQVPDVNRDEPDKLDEALVTWNSRDKERKNFDLTDDKLFQLIQELGKHTKNVLYIFDTCHSGALNRGTATALEVSPDTRPQPTPQETTTVPGDGKSLELLTGSDSYVMITGAQSSGLAYEMETKPYTALTYYLIQAMNDAKPEMSYQDLMNNVIRGVSQNNLNQRPQLLGDRFRSVLNGTAVDQDIYIRILPSGIQGDQLKIEAGATTGLQINNMVAIYDKDKLRFVGKDGRKALGKVTNLNAASATVTFTLEPGIAALDERDKVVLLSPLYGSPQIKVGLISLDGEAARATAAGMQKKIIESPLLKESKLINLENLTISEVNEFRTGKLPGRFAKPEDFPTVFVRRGTFGEAFIKGKPFMKVADEKAVTGRSYVTDNTPDSTEVFYITDSSGEPVFDFYVRTAEEKSDEKIVTALLKLARQRNLTALDNKQSPLRNSIKTVEDKPGATGRRATALDKVELQFLKVELGKDDAEKTIISSEKPVVPDELFLYDFYRLQITNKTAQKLHVYLLNISTDGSISVMYPEINCAEADPISPGAPPVKMEAAVYRLTTPLGFEKFKVIVSTKPAPAICYLEQAAAKRGNLNPLEVLFDEILMGKTRNGTGGDVDSWGTAELMIDLKPRPQQ